MISIFHAITSLIVDNLHVIVISYDFSKAFDTVLHSSLLQKLALLDIPGNVYNWILDFLRGIHTVLNILTKHLLSAKLLLA